MKKTVRVRKSSRSVARTNRLLDPYMDPSLTIPAVVVKSVGRSFRISATGEAAGGTVDWVYGAILRADQKIPSQPPLSARRNPAQLIQVNATRCLYLFIAGTSGAGLGPVRLGIDNRIVTWARIGGKTVMSSVCLQFNAMEGMLDPRWNRHEVLPTDYHQIDYPLAPQIVQIGRAHV